MLVHGFSWGGVGAILTPFVAGRRSFRVAMPGQRWEFTVITVSTEPHRKLVRARMGGLLTVEEVMDFSRREQDAARAMGLGSGEFVLLVDVAEDVVQTQEVMKTFFDLMQNSPLKARRIASVRKGALNRLQSRRLRDVRSNVEVFDDTASAEAWLFEMEDA